MPFGHGYSIFKLWCFLWRSHASLQMFQTRFLTRKIIVEQMWNIFLITLKHPPSRLWGAFFAYLFLGETQLLLTGPDADPGHIALNVLEPWVPSAFDYNVHDVHVNNDCWIGLAGMRLLTFLQVKRIKQRYMTWIKAPPPPNHTQPIVWHAPSQTGTAPYRTSVSKEGAPTPAWKKRQVDSAWCKISFSQDHGLHWVVPTHDRQTYSYTIRID